MEKVNFKFLLDFIYFFKEFTFFSLIYYVRFVLFNFKIIYFCILIEFICFY